MKVKTLIKILKKCNQEFPIFVFFEDDIYEIEVDNTITDRIDLNIVNRDEEWNNEPDDSDADAQWLDNAYGTNY